MIDISIYEKRLEECLKTETGKPYNKWTTETRSELAKQSLELAQNLIKEFEQHKNELVIDNYNVVRLFDLDSDKYDMYWCYEKQVGGMLNDTIKYESSCIIGHIYLKGVLPDTEYDELVRVWNLNNINNVI